MERHTRRKMISLAYRCAFTRLGLNYYTLYEMMCEEDSLPEKIRGISREFNRILGEFLEGGQETSQADALRNRITEDMEVATAYTDCFQIYEYVLNRVERRFVKGEDIKYSIDEFVASLMGVLSQSDDGAVMNGRIQEIMGQLPVRYTKQKFYSLLMERLAIYAGTGKRNFEDVLYMLRTSAMVSQPKNMEAEQPELYAILEKLRQVDYRAMDKEQYWECNDGIHGASARLNREAGFYLIASELVNDLYVLLLARPEALVDSQEEQMFQGLAKGVWSQFQKDDKGPLPERLTQYLEGLEGIQEEAIERLGFDEAEQDEKLLKIAKLMSGSPFARLDETAEADETADRQWIEDKGMEFCRELDEAFGHMKKPVARAVMAKLFTYLPVVFSSMGEVEEYIRGSLESCADLAEREACMEILTWELIDEDVLV